MPVILLTGITFSVTQFLSSNYLGPELPDILSALVSILALGIFLKFWKPRTIFRFSAEQELDSTLAVNEPDEEEAHTGGQIFKAWSPFVILTVIISIWGIPVVKQALTGHYEGSNLILNGLNSVGQVFTFIPNVPLLNNNINIAGDTVPAFYKLEFLGAAGTAFLLQHSSQSLFSEFLGKIGSLPLLRHLMS